MVVVTPMNRTQARIPYALLPPTYFWNSPVREAMIYPRPCPNSDFPERAQCSTLVALLVVFLQHPVLQIARQYCEVIWESPPRSLPCQRSRQLPCLCIGSTPWGVFPSGHHRFFYCHHTVQVGDKPLILQAGDEGVPWSATTLDGPHFILSDIAKRGRYPLWLRAAAGWCARHTLHSVHHWCRQVASPLTLIDSARDNSLPGDGR